MKTLFKCCSVVFLSVLLLPSRSSADVVILDDDFSGGSVAATFRAYESTIDTGWRKAPGYGSVQESEWMISGGQVSNSSSVAGGGYPTTQPSETPLFNFFSSAGASEEHLRLAFDYSVASGDKLYVHLWGYTGTASTPGGFVSNIEASSNGNMNVSEGAAGSTLDGYNLTDGATSGYGASSNAISGELTGSGTFDLTFRISDLGISGVTNESDFSYFLVQFGKDEDGTAGTTAIDNFSFSAIPEPSSLSLLALGLTGMLVRRRK